MLDLTKIHPDDLNKNTTIGVSFPLMEGVFLEELKPLKNK